MNKLIILAIALAAGLTAFPQATKSTKETKSEKSGNQKQEVRQSTQQTRQNTKQAATQQGATRSKSQDAARSQSQQQEQQQQQVQKQQQQQQQVQKQQQQQKQVEQQQQKQVQQQQQQQKLVQQQQQKQEQTQRQSKSQAATQAQTQRENQSRNNAATQARSKADVQSRSQAETQSRNEAAARTAKQQNDRANSDGRTAVVKQQEAASGKSGFQARSQAANTRAARPAEPEAVRVKNSAATRVYRETKGSLTRDDGTVVRHQNDVVFAKSRNKIDYDNTSSLRGSVEFRQTYRDYNNWYDYRSVRPARYNTGYHPVSMEIRRVRNVYRQPVYYNIIWTPNLFNRFMYYYPDQTDWDFEYGNEIETISAYEAMNYVGTVRRVYGRVDEVYYSREDDNYTLYIGDRFPYQDLSIVIPHDVVVTITGDPVQYFQDQYVWMIGLIDLWGEKPEIIIRDEQQIQRY